MERIFKFDASGGNNFGTGGFEFIDQHSRSIIIDSIWAEHFPEISYTINSLDTITRFSAERTSTEVTSLTIHEIIRVVDCLEQNAGQSDVLLTIF